MSCTFVNEMLYTNNTNVMSAHDVTVTRTACDAFACH